MSKNVYLQTIVRGCAWCGKVMGFSTHEVQSKGEEKHIMISHGMCECCHKKMMAPLQEEEKEASKDNFESEEDEENLALI